MLNCAEDTVKHGPRLQNQILREPRWLLKRLVDLRRVVCQGSGAGRQQGGQDPGLH